MANQATNNLHGTVASDNTVANLVTLASPAQIVGVSISGSGAARCVTNSATPNVTTNSSITAGVGYFPFKAPPGSGGISTLLLYANGSESTLTYDIAIVDPGHVQTS